jgi:hypothetical protein
MRQTQPISSSAAMVAARVATSTSAPADQSRFHTQAPDTTIPLSQGPPVTTGPARPATSGTEHFYVPSNVSGGPSDDNDRHRYDGADYEDDAYDSEADREREAMYAQQHGQAQQQRTSQPLESYTSASAMPQQSPTAQDIEASTQIYGAGTGWQGITGTTTHRHPTRLSDIVEERSGRTSPSRASYVSGGQSAAEGYARR